MKIYDILEAKSEYDSMEYEIDRINHIVNSLWDLKNGKIEEFKILAEDIDGIIFQIVQPLNNRVSKLRERQEAIEVLEK